MLSFVVLASVLIVVLVLLVKRQYSYWQRLNIPFSKPKFPLGSISVPKIDNTIPQQITRLYQRHRNSDCPIIGFHAFLTPIVILADLKLIRSVLIGDFDHFQNRGKYYNERDDPLSENLLNVEHEKWKPLRNRWSPCFTSSKLKFMFPTIAAVGNELVDCLSEMVKTDTEVKICDLLACYFTDMIASCAFGIEANSLKDPTVKFRTMGKKVFETPKFSMFELLLVSEFPGLAKFLRLCEHHKDVTDYYMNVINETMEYRTTHDIRRNDFMDVLIQMRSNSSSGESVNFTMNEIAAQAFLFFTAGFQGPSITLTNSLYELAMDRHKHIQDKARSEIQLVLKRSSGKLTYDALAEMVYCEQIVNETLRKDPLTSIFARITTKPYKVPNTDFTMPKGMFCVIPIYSIHHDPNYYPNPEEFIPERFSPEEVQKRPSGSFIAFADGPRKCVGERFAMLQMKLGLVCLLRSFEFSTCDRTTIPLQFCPKSLVNTPASDVWLQVKPIN